MHGRRREERRQAGIEELARALADDRADMAARDRQALAADAGGEVQEEGDSLRLRRRFLSEKYAEAYRKYDRFLPETLTVTKEQVAAADPELIRKFVLLDLPPNYC